MSTRRIRRTLRRRDGCLCCCLWLASCGETNRSGDDASDASTPTSTQAAASNTNTTTGATHSSSNGSSSGPSTTTGSAASGTTAGAGSGGGTSVTGTGDTSTGGAAGADGSTATGGSTGTGGSASTGGGTGGTAGTGGGLSDCSSPYDGPVGGPRSGGPERIAVLCEEITDDVILARYDDLDAKVPQGLYWEPPGIVSYWGEACSQDPSETLDRASELPIGDVEHQGSSDWSHEVSGCYQGSRRFYSDLSCDYFDGTALAGTSHEDLAYLASLLWWFDNGNLTGAQILGYAANSLGDTDFILMCTIRTSFGDFGLCDQITLEQTIYGLYADGSVTIEETETVRTLEGTCN